MNKKNLFISNLAWNHYDFLKVIKILNSHNIKGLDLAPIKINKNWSLAIKESIKFNKTLNKFGLKVNAIQGIFYNTSFNLFNLDKSKSKKLEKHIEKLLIISKIFKCNKLILGSSNFRDRGKLSMSEANHLFISFFKKIIPLLKKNKISICFEPIPKEYGENYLNTTNDIVYIIKRLNSKWFGINFDTSLFHYEKFDKKKFLNQKKYIRNIQISEKKFKHFLKPSKNNILFCKLMQREKKVNNLSLEIISKKTELKKLSASLKNLRRLFNQ